MVGPTTPAGGGVGDVLVVDPALLVADGAGVFVAETMIISVGVGVFVGVNVPVGVTDAVTAGVVVGVGVFVGLGVTLIAFVGVTVGVMLGTQLCFAVTGAPCEQAFTGVTVQLYECPESGVKVISRPVVFPDLTTCPVVVSRIS